MKSFQIYSIRISEWKTIFGVSTYLKGGKLRYNCTIIDLYDRSVVIINLFFVFGKELELDVAVAEFAYGWYNQVRPHTYNEGLTPAARVAKNDATVPSSLASL